VPMVRAGGSTCIMVAKTEQPACQGPDATGMPARRLARRSRAAGSPLPMPAACHPEQRKLARRNEALRARTLDPTGGPPKRTDSRVGTRRETSVRSL
jgi:hypothetical protein